MNESTIHNIYHSASMLSIIIHQCLYLALEDHRGICSFVLGVFMNIQTLCTISITQVTHSLHYFYRSFTSFCTFLQSQCLCLYLFMQSLLLACSFLHFDCSLYYGQSHSLDAFKSHVVWWFPILIYESNGPGISSE